MARMKFICDAERCIECNGCVTACKIEHDVPWGVNRRRVVTLNDGTIRICALVAVTVSTHVPSARRSFRKREPSVFAARWTNAPSALAALKRTAQKQRSKNMDAIACLRASCLLVPRCARPRPCSLATVMCSPTSIVNA